MKRILVLGSLGMAGHVMYQYLKSFNEYEVIGVARSTGPQVDYVLDVTQFDALEALLAEIAPDVVVNCIGILLSGSSKSICDAILINSYLPHFLARSGEAQQFKLIQISTDCVFSGASGGYKESAFRDGDDAYARTKALGELESLNNLTIRTSIIGPELKINGEGLMHWFFMSKGPIAGYARAFWTGLTTLELAKVVRYSINDEITGLIQPCPKEKISKYMLLRTINDVWSRDIAIDSNSDYQVDKSLLCTRDDFHYAVPGYREMLLDMKLWTDANKKLYSHYRF